MIRSPALEVRVHEAAITDAKADRQLVPPICIEIDLGTVRTKLAVISSIVGVEIHRSGIIKIEVRADPQKINHITYPPIRIKQRQLIIG